MTRADFFSQKHARWGIPAILIVALIGILAFAFRPARVAEQALTKFAAADTADFVAELQLGNNEATQQLLGEEGVVEIVLDGVLERSEETRDSLASNLAITIRTESVQVQVKGELRLIDDKLYLYIEKSPQVFPVLAELKGEWIAFNRGGQSEPQEEAEAVELFSTVRRTGTEKIDGTTTVHYTAQATSEAVISMMDTIADLLGTQLTETQIDDIRASVSQVEEVPVELWVERFSRNLKRLRTTLTIPGGNTVDFTLTVNDQNQPVTIETPTDANTIEEAIRAAQAGQ